MESVSKREGPDASAKDLAEARREERLNFSHSSYQLGESDLGRSIISNDLIIKAENNKVKVSFGSFNKGFFGVDGGKVNLDKGSIEKMSINFPPPRTRAGNIENFKLRCKKL